MTESVRESNCTSNLFKELKDFTGFELPNVSVNVGKQSAIQLATVHTKSNRSKYVLLENHYCREQYLEGKIDVKQIHTDSYLADLLTKPRSNVSI